ncbi:hypothetical protein BSLA_01r0179 [Burkholderia stabilis]|nr:hypothetical protein BSLA_01r0179 [Burkholderia stabilis]
MPTDQGGATRRPISYGMPHPPNSRAEWTQTAASRPRPLR